jgi:hypothetical protein
MAPLTLHLASALQTVILMVTVRERAGVSETVQVVAYATAPCVFAGLPVPTIRLVSVGWGFLLLVLGVATVHNISVPRALLAVFIPGLLVFGYAFGGLFAFELVTGLDIVGTNPPVATTGSGPESAGP